MNEKHPSLIASKIHDLSRVLSPFEIPKIKKINQNGQFIDYGANGNYCSKNNIATAGDHTYYISPISSCDKFSISYIDCIGMAAVGTSSSNPHENLSILTHQNLGSTLGLDETLIDSQESFQNTLEERIRMLVGQCVQNSIDAVIFGGEIHSNLWHNYIEGSKQVNNLVTKVLKFSPRCLNGPSRRTGSQHFYLDTMNRTLHVVRHPQPLPQPNKTFFADNIEDEIKGRWKRNTQS